MEEQEKGGMDGYLFLNGKGVACEGETTGFYVVSVREDLLGRIFSSFIIWVLLIHYKPDLGFKNASCGSDIWQTLLL